MWGTLKGMFGGHVVLLVVVCIFLLITLWYITLYVSRFQRKNMTYKKYSEKWS